MKLDPSGISLSVFSSSPAFIQGGLVSFCGVKGIYLRGSHLKNSHRSFFSISVIKEKNRLLLYPGFPLGKSQKFLKESNQKQN